MRISENTYNKLMNYKQNKYRNNIVYYDNKKFDSKKERNRYVELKKLEKFKVISDLKTQVPFLLLDTIRYKNKTYRKTYYYADFTYKQNGKLIVEDVKSEATRKDKVYRLKIKILLSKYKDIEFVEKL